MASNDNFHVLVIGGGACGLSIANGLQNAGIRYTVFEKDSEQSYYNKTRDWGMLLHWGKEFLMKNLSEDLQLEFGHALVDPNFDATGETTIPHVNGVTGELIASVSMPGMVRVSRKKLRNLLLSSEPALNINVEFPSKASTGSAVKATFEDGSVEKGNVIIGCDGPSSRVRNFLVGPEAGKATDSGTTIINYDVSGFTTEQSLSFRQYHPLATCFYNPEISGIFLLCTLDASDAHRPETWKFQLHHSWWGEPSATDLKDPKARLKFFKERSKSLCPPFCTIAEALSDDTVLPADPGRQWTPFAWDNHNGTVTIAGDAAHPMLPNRGQGLNNAMQDAAEIVDAIKQAHGGRHSLEEAVTAYEETMRPRAAMDVALSLEVARKLLVADLKESPMFKLGLQNSSAPKETLNAHSVRFGA